MLAQTVGFSWTSVGAMFAPRRRCFDKLHALSTFSQVLRLRTLFHVLRVDWSPSSIHIPSSARCACRGCISRARLLWVVTAELSRLCLLFQLHFVVVYSAVLADSPSGTSDTTAWSSVRGRCSRFSVEVLYNNPVCCLSPFSFSRARGRPHVFEFCRDFVGAFRESLLAAPSSPKLYECRLNSRV